MRILRARYFVASILLLGSTCGTFVTEIARAGEVRSTTVASESAPLDKKPPTNSKSSLPSAPETDGKPEKPLVSPTPTLHGVPTSSQTTADSSCVAAVKAIEQLEAKLKPPQPESIFTKIRHDYVSNLVWEFFGYHRDKGGYLPFITALITLLAALLKLGLFFSSRARGSVPYHLLDLVATASFLVVGILAVSIVFGGPMVSRPEQVDLQPIEDRIANLDKQSKKILERQSTFDPHLFTSLVSSVSQACGKFEKTQASEIRRIEQILVSVGDSAPGEFYKFIIFLLCTVAAGATIYLVGRERQWW